MDKFVVPQFIDAEDKIIGPLTVRQFLIMLATAVVLFILYTVLTLEAFILAGLLTFSVGGTLAFYRINGQPFHFFLLNFVQTLQRPGLRTWNKELTDAEVRFFMNELPPPPPPPRIRKEPLAETRLSELSLVVNTGGLYNPDED
jgi:hypothetical protein